jgi:hypothetical protein
MQHGGVKELYLRRLNPYKCKKHKKPFLQRFPSTETHDNLLQKDRGLSLCQTWLSSYSIGLITVNFALQNVI